MPLIPWIDYEAMLDGIARGAWRVIGWGAGASFSFFNRNTVQHHDYLVDSNPSKWGTRHDGYEVRPPHAIAAEDPSRTIVIIYNYRDHGKAILSDLEHIGPYKAIMSFHPPVLRAFAHRLKQGVDCSLLRKGSANSDTAILVQGPLEDGVTEWVVRYYANQYPNDWLIVSTWLDSQKELVEKISPFCDRILLNRSPSTSGLGNRNLQIQSTLNGLNEILNIGLKKTLKTRTNTLNTANNILERTSSLQGSFPKNICNDYGLSNRIVVTERITMRFVPYMISDILMFGDTKDLIRYWSTPLDARSLNFSTWSRESFKSISKKREMTEIYIASHFLDNIGWKCDYTLKDYWDVLRNFFVVTDER